MKKQKLKLLFLPLPLFLCTLIPCSATLVISGNLIPYQDPPPELLLQYNSYAEVMGPLWVISLACSLAGLALTAVSVIYLLVRTRN